MAQLKEGSVIRKSTGDEIIATINDIGVTTWAGITDKPGTFPPSTHSHTKADVGLSSVLNYGIATQTEAETGTSNAKYTTPLRVKQAIDKAISTMGSGGTSIITSATEPSLETGDQWHKEI